jgi:multidrug efflux pump subunit AcrB
VKLSDVARVELGGQSYGTSARLNGHPSTGIGVQLSPTGNALATADRIKKRMAELAPYFPPSVQWSIPYDSSRFIKISITRVVETLVEAVVLVFLVMYLFLQSFRYTLIPTIVVPVSLFGAFGVMQTFGFSINVLTMFAMVLAVGILVDDAIVVIENVERIMSEEGLSPRDATKKAMGQITAALVGISTTLVSVFLPMAFFAGAVGNIYRQFSLVMVSAMLFSVFLALSLTPALCEETFFRGLMLSGLRRWGAWAAIFITALLFGLLHGSIYRLLPTFTLGLVLGYAVWRSGSLYCSILIHALNNGLIATLVWSNGGKDLQAQSIPWSFTLGALAIMAIGLALLTSPKTRANAPSSGA